MKRITHTLAFRLFVILASVQTVILLALAFGVIRVQQSSLMEQVVTSAGRVSDLIARSTRHSMLVNMKEDVDRIIGSIGGQPGIEKIRIYNKQGTVIFATASEDLHTTVDMNAEACVTCHAATGLEHPQSPTGELSRIITKANGERVLGLITPIRNEVQCSDAPCHAHPADKTILGVLDVQMSLAQVDNNLNESKLQLMYLSLGAILLIGLVSGGFAWLFVRRPVQRLMGGMELVASGHLEQKLDATGRDELGQLARTFNDMTVELAKARKEITEWSQTLEQKVRQKTDDLERVHKRMLVVEKMASLGNLSSSVAHELNNPLEGILTYAKLLIKRLAKLNLPPEQFRAYEQELQLIADEAQRCGTIVKNLLVFARQKGVSFQQASMREILRRSTMLVRHHAEMRNIEVTSTCTESDTLECDQNQIQQVLVALMMNAIEAMSPAAGKGTAGRLSVDVVRSGTAESLMIRVADNGPGISDGVKAKIFEPFFTTKSEGKGVGLGLAIAYGIVEQHHGAISVDSALGSGTTFTVTLPVRQPEQTGAQALASYEGKRQ